MDQKKIGAFLKKLRTEKTITQEQLGQMLQVSGRTVSRWETGANLPELEVLVKLAEFYHVDIRELMNGERQSPTVREQKDTLVQVAQYAQEEKKRIKKKRMVAIVLLAALVLMCIAQAFQDNYQLGLELYNEANSLAVVSDRVIRSIEFLQQAFKKDEINRESVFRGQMELQSALDEALLYFGYRDMPILEEVRMEYITWLERLRSQTATEEAVMAAFTQWETAGKIDTLKDLLTILTHRMMGFHERYNQTPQWKRYFAAWAEERRILTEQVRLPEYMIP